MVTTKKKGSYIERLLTSRLCVMVEYLKLTKRSLVCLLLFYIHARMCGARRCASEHNDRKNENTTIDKRAENRNNYLCAIWRNYESIKRVQTTRQDMRSKANVVSSEVEVEAVSEVCIGIPTEFAGDFY